MTTPAKALEMHNPPHPGMVFRRLYLDPLELTVTETAKRLGVTRKALSELVNGRSGVSPEMAIRISMATTSTAESWLSMQMYYDLWQAKEKTKKRRVQQLAA